MEVIANDSSQSAVFRGNGSARGEGTGELHGSEWVLLIVEQFDTLYGLGVLTEKPEMEGEIADCAG